MRKRTLEEFLEERTTKRERAHSGFAGVFLTKTGQCTARLRHGGAQVYLGTFGTPVRASCLLACLLEVLRALQAAAALAVDVAALRWRGSKAQLNFPREARSRRGK